jgi:hypothetical protein
VPGVPKVLLSQMGDGWVKYYQNHYGWAAGGLCSRAGDLLKWERMILMRYNTAKGIGFDAIKASERITLPMLIIDAGNEELMNIKDNGQRVADILKARGTDVEYHVIPGIPLAAWLFVLPFAAAMLALEELRKWIVRGQRAPTSHKDAPQSRASHGSLS